MTTRAWLGFAIVATMLLAGRRATAETYAESAPTTSAPRPYSLPWQLKPVLAQTTIRSDTILARYRDPGGRSGMTVLSSLGGGYKIPGTGAPAEGLTVTAKLTVVNDSPPAGNGGLVLANPIIGAGLAIRPAPALRMGFSLGLTLPFGGGGGDNPDPGSLSSRTKGAIARSSMDNGVFGVNDLGLSPSVGIALVTDGLTIQLDTTLIHSIRTRGKNAQLEATKTNFTSGLHVGYFVVPELSFGVELRYQRFINPPLSVERDATRASLDNLTIAGGPRVHIKVGDHWFRPGISYARGLDKPMAASAPSYHIVQIDLPFVF